MPSPSGPGDWSIAWSALPASRAVTDADKPVVGPMAVAALWAATGRRFGLMTHTHTVKGWMLTRYLCNPTSVIALPGPVYDVLQVAGGATVYPTTAYAQIGDQLLRTAPGRWPDSVIVVTYRRGTPVPVGGDIAAADLAAEIALGRRGGKCRLPARATTVSREGVDITLGDPLDYLAAGLTGVPEVDGWITTHNPGGQHQDSVAWSPDLARRQQLGPYPYGSIPRIGRPW